MKKPRILKILENKTAIIELQNLSCIFIKTWFIPGGNS